MANESISILRRRDVQARTGLSKTKLYDLMAAGDFPRPINIAGNSVGWPSNWIDNWIAERIAAAEHSSGCAA